MSTSVISDSAVVLPPPPPSQPPSQVDSATCDCCGLKEECTVAYIERIRARYQGKWICGLCAEAVNDEVLRCERLEEALTRHLHFCKTFQSSSPPPNPTLRLITAMRHVLRKSLDSPKLRSMPSSPTKEDRPTGLSLARSESCIPAISLVDLDSSPPGQDCGT